jgi:chromosome segregation ATPase
MTDGLERLPERVDVLERKLDTLSASVDERFDAVNRRFDAVDRRFEAIDRRFEALDERLEREFQAISDQFVEQRKYTEFAFERLQAHIDTRLEGLERTLGVHTNQLSQHSSQLSRLERKVDQLLDLQLRPSGRARRRLLPKRQK